MNQVIEENVYLRNLNQKVILHINNDSLNTSDNELIDQQELKKKVKAFHKRQKTHVNFHHLTNINKDATIKSDISGTNDLFDLTISELNSSRTMRKISDIDTRETAESGGSISNPVNSSLNKPLGKQLYLFYRTPNNKDNKKFDFSECNNE
jgi:hypothetical protein